MLSESNSEPLVAFETLFSVWTNATESDTGLAVPGQAALFDGEVPPAGESRQTVLELPGAKARAVGVSETAVRVHPRQHQRRRPLYQHLAQWEFRDARVEHHRPRLPHPAGHRTAPRAGRDAGAGMVAGVTRLVRATEPLWPTACTKDSGPHNRRNTNDGN